MSTGHDSERARRGQVITHRVIEPSGCYFREELTALLQCSDDFIDSLRECCGLLPVTRKPFQYLGRNVLDALERFGRGETIEKAQPLKQEEIRQRRKDRIKAKKSGRDGAGGAS